MKITVESIIYPWPYLINRDLGRGSFSSLRISWATDRAWAGYTHAKFNMVQKINLYKKNMDWFLKHAQSKGLVTINRFLLGIRLGGLDVGEPGYTPKQEKVENIFSSIVGSAWKVVD